MQFSWNAFYTDLDVCTHAAVRIIETKRRDVLHSLYATTVRFANLK